MYVSLAIEVCWRICRSPDNMPSIDAFRSLVFVNPASGELDVTIWSGFGWMDFIRKRHMLYDGSHVCDPGTLVLRVRRAIATSESTLLLELDGESVGRLPAQLDALAGAIRLKV
jgi:diacylglycerol kinase family enzyme